MLHVLPLLHDAVLHRVADLQHGAGGSGLVAAHNVLDDEVIVALFLASKDRPADYRRVLELGEVLRRVTYFEEPGSSVEDCSVTTTRVSPNVHIKIDTSERQGW